jgi:hypothetical protein
VIPVVYGIIPRGVDNMNRSMLIVAVLLIAAEGVMPLGAQESKEHRELKKKYPFLSRLDIPTDKLPKGCSKPDLQPEDFPIAGIRQGGVTTDSRAIAALDRDRRGPNVGAENIHAIYLASYKERGELGVVGYAFADTQVANDAYNNMKKEHDDYRVWLCGKNVVWLWRDTGTTDQCIREMALIIEVLVERHGGGRILNDSCPLSPLPIDHERHHADSVAD